MAQGAKWVRAAGGVVTDEEGQTGVEVSALISYVSAKRGPRPNVEG